MISPKSAVKEKMKYSNTSGAASIGSASSENGNKNNLSVMPDKLLPVYLRLPQAERELKKKKEVSL